MIKFILILLACTHLANSSRAAPAEPSEDIKVTPLKAVNVRLSLLGITLDGLTNLHILFVGNGVKFFKKVLDDPQVKAVKTEAMKENIEKIQSLLNKLEKNQKGIDAKIVGIFNDYDDIVTKFDKEANDNLSEDEEIIAKSFKENDLEDFDAAVKAQFKKSVEKFTKEFDGYFEGLTEKEKKDEETLIRCFDKLKAEKNVIKQFNMFRGFFKDFIDSSSESSE